MVNGAEFQRATATLAITREHSVEAGAKEAEVGDELPTEALSAQPPSSRSHGKPCGVQSRLGYRFAIVAHRYSLAGGKLRVSAVSAASAEQPFRGARQFLAGVPRGAPALRKYGARHAQSSERDGLRGMRKCVPGGGTSANAGARRKILAL